MTDPGGFAPVRQIFHSGDKVLPLQLCLVYSHCVDVEGSLAAEEAYNMDPV